MRWTIELIVVLGSSALIVHAQQPRAREASAAAKLRQIGQGLKMYANENRGQLPAALGQVVVYGLPASTVEH